MWGERGLISHKFEGTGEGGAGVCTEGLPRGCARVHGATECEPGVQLAVARWARLAAGRVPNGCELGVQLAVARWARLSAGRVLNGRAAGGCPMGQAVSWAGALWACSWRLPDGPGCQLGMLWLSRRAAEDAGHTRYAGAIYFSHQIMMMASDIAQIIYIFKYHNKHSVIYAHIQGIICHMIYSYTTMAVERGAYEHNKIQKGLLWYMWMGMTRGCRSTLWLPCHQQQNFPHQQCIHRLTDIIQVINQERQKNHGASLHIKAINTHNKET